MNLRRVGTVGCVCGDRIVSFEGRSSGATIGGTAVADVRNASANVASSTTENSRSIWEMLVDDDFILLYSVVCCVCELSY